MSDIEVSVSRPTFTFYVDSQPNNLEVVAAGPPGPTTDLAVASTTTVGPTENADVSIAGDPPNQELSFQIPRGSLVISGVVPPLVGDGEDGDLYLDKTTSNLYGPKTGGAWPSPINLNGAPSSLYDANTILKADIDNTPIALTVPASTLVGRGASGGIAALAPATVRAGFDLAQAGTVGNLLTANQASVETDTTGLGSGYNTTVSRDTDQKFMGTASLKAVANSSDVCSFGDSAATAVTPGGVYTASTMVRAAQATPLRVKIQWYTSGDVYISESSGSLVSCNGAWTLAQHTAVAPANAALARVLNSSDFSPSTGNVFWSDARGLWAGAGGDWAMPGTPITNLGHRVTHPNTDDVLVEKWDAGLGRWQRVHYDSGWRRILQWSTTDTFVLGTAPDTTTFTYEGSGSFQIRRIGDIVRVFMPDGSVKMAAGSSSVSMGALLYLPAGFSGINTAPPAMFVSGASAWQFQATADRLSRAGNATFPAVGTYMPGGVEFVFPTAAAIPTSLPGTLVSAAPA